MSEIKRPQLYFPGYQLDKYTIERLIGRGRSTEVYRAQHPRFNRTVAIKVFRLDGNRTAGTIAQFHREAEAVASLKHPNIIRIYEFAAHRDVYYLVMELVEGTRLRDMITAHPTGLARDEALRLFGQIASGIAFAHERKVVHGNIKPDNVLLDSGNRPVLVDFGLPSLEKSQRRTPAYMSPQQLAQQPATPACDIYALGILLYEMITGDLPFKGNTFEEVIHQQLRTTPIPPSQITIGLDPRIEHVILAALHKHAKDRPASAREMIRILESEAAHEYETLNLARHNRDQIQKRRSEITRFVQSRTDEPIPESRRLLPWFTRARLMVWGGVLLLAIIAIVLAVLML